MTTDASDPLGPARQLTVPELAAGMRLDTFLSRWFRDWSRTALARAVRQGLVRVDGRALRASTRLRAGAVVAVYIPGIAPTDAKPPPPPVLYAHGALRVVDKPAGLLCHPAGSAWAWSVIGLLKESAPSAELVHRLDRDTSGCLAVTLDPALNATLKARVAAGEAVKVYEALCRGQVPWEERTLDGPIGPADGPIRIEMAVRPDGRPARTDVTVLERGEGMTRVRCRIYTGRTHQIRVHLAHAGFPLLGDRLYGVPPALALRALEEGVDDEVLAAAGAPHHALHAAHLELPLPDGDTAIVDAPLPEHFTAWWRPGR